MDADSRPQVPSEDNSSVSLDVADAAAARDDAPKTPMERYLSLPR